MERGDQSVHRIGRRSNAVGDRDGVSVYRDDVVDDDASPVDVQETGDLPLPWRKHGRGGMILPQDLDSEGMSVFCYRAP